MGSCVSLFQQRYSRTSIRIKRTAPHFLFATNPAIQEPDGNIKTCCYEYLKNHLGQKTEEIIHTLPVNEQREFDTHDFINTFLKLDDNAYAALLVQYKDAKGSFKAFHGCIARYLNSLERRGIIEKVRDKTGKKIRRVSLNIKGNMTSNQMWIKL